MDPNSNFQQSIVENLEGCHNGEFVNGTMESVSNDIHKRKEDNPCHICPTETLPKPPSEKCQTHSENENSQSECQACQDYYLWWKKYVEEVDEILYQSNRHVCRKRCRKQCLP